MWGLWPTPHAMPYQYLIIHRRPEIEYKLYVASRSSPRVLKRAGTVPRPVRLPLCVTSYYNRHRDFSMDIIRTSRRRTLRCKKNRTYPSSSTAGTHFLAGTTAWTWNLDTRSLLGCHGATRRTTRVSMIFSRKKRNTDIPHVDDNLFDTGVF